MAIVNNVVADFFTLPKTDETRQNYLDFQAGKIDIFGNPKGTSLAESVATTTQAQSEPVQVAEEPVQVAEDTSGMFTGTQNDINSGFIDTSTGFAEQTSVDLDKRKANIKQELEKQYETVQLSGYS